MMAGGIHLLKLCVGVESVGDLEAHIAARGARQQVHVTRMWPKKSDELLDGGSLYWVIKGTILARQRITGFEPRRGEDGIERCAILLDPELVRTQPAPRRPFQGWRYLRAGDAPADLDASHREDLPPELAAELAAIGVF